MIETKILVPKSIAEAILLLAKHGEKCRVIAGGTDLVARMKKTEMLPESIINIGGIEELAFIDYDEKSGLSIGALTAIDTIGKSSLVRSKFGVLAQSASMLGSPVIRRQATIGGNICNAAPSADMAPALIVLGAMVKITGKTGERTMPIEDLFIGPGQTDIKSDEMLLEVQIPEMPPHSAAVYLKQTRRQGADLSIAGVAALVTMTGDVLQEVKIALGAVAPTPIRAEKAEAILRGNRPDDTLLEKAAQVASDEASPIDDVRSSADYRRKLVKVLVRRAVKEAVTQAR